MIWKWCHPEQARSQGGGGEGTRAPQQNSKIGWTFLDPFFFTSID